MSQHVEAKHGQATRSRVLVLVTSSETGGAQTFIQELVDGLGHRYDFHVAAQGGGALEDACLSLAVPFHHMRRLRRPVNPARDAAAVIEIRQLVRRLKPALIHLHSSKAGALGRIANATTGVPAVFTVHGWAFETVGRASQLHATAERLLARMAAELVCVSRWDRELAIDRRIAAPRRVHVIHNGVAEISGRPRATQWPQHPRLACIARLSPQKDVPLLLRALAQHGLERWRLDIFGNGPDRNAVAAQIEALGLSDRVQLRGEQSGLAEQLVEYDAFALPSHWEGLPFSVLEAMAAGLPVIASDVGGVAEAVVDGETGILVQRGDLAGFEKALRTLLEHGDWSRSLGHAGRARVREHFRLETMLSRYDALFSSLVDGARALH